MGAWNVTLGVNASTKFTNYEFDSFCKGADGNYYGIRAEGLYLLSGDSDNGTDIDAHVDLGTLNFGSSLLKRGYAAYLAGTSDDKMVMGVNGYEYVARSFDDAPSVHRVDIGKGIRANYFDLTVGNRNGAAFELDSVEFKPAGTGRRI
jgi:hypothetical protein